MSSENKWNVPPTVQAQPVIVQATAVPVNNTGAGIYGQPGSIYTPGTPGQYYAGAPAQVMMSNQGFYSRLPRRVICAFCGADIMTKTSTETGLGTHLLALGLCFAGCWPCCLIPYCCDDAKDVIHTCPQCNQHVGIKAVM
jgi:hypothetical protein